MVKKKAVGEAGAQTVRVVAVNDLRPSKGRTELKASQVKALKSVPELRDAVALLLQAAGIGYNEAA